MLHGRTDEITWLTSLVADARRGNGRAVILTGDAGIGKTSLLDQVASAARRHDVHVLSGSAEELEQPVPFAAIGHCLGVRDARGDAADEDLKAIGQLLAKNLGDAPAAAARTDFVITEAIVALLEQWCARRPVALF